MDKNSLLASREMISNEVNHIVNNPFYVSPVILQMQHLEH